MQYMLLDLTAAILLEKSDLLKSFNFIFMLSWSTCGELEGGENIDEYRISPRDLHNKTVRIYNNELLLKTNKDEIEKAPEIMQKKKRVTVNGDSIRQWKMFCTIPKMLIMLLLSIFTTHLLMFHVSYALESVERKAADECIYKTMQNL